jgi:hypothetical protein
VGLRILIYIHFITLVSSDYFPNSFVLCHERFLDSSALSRVCIQNSGILVNVWNFHEFEFIPIYEITIYFLTG